MKARSFPFGWLIGVVLLVGGAAAWAFLKPGATPESEYLLDTVSRGDLIETVSANGTLNPVTLVSVGTQVSGTALKVSADFNDQVTQGQVLVELDPAAYEARVRQTRAAKESAEASLELARTNAARARDLFDKGYIAQQELEQSAQMLKSAAAQVESARAQVEDAEVDLRNSVIRSPVAGVVVDRTVDVGQTVAASFQTPTLFKIAGDLRRMLIHTTFAEADIGRIQPGQAARFTVDAFPDRSFDGRVRQVRLNPTTTQNVVTYDVVVDVDNQDMTLLPGMTAYVNVVLSRSEAALRVPNSALRFRPRDAAEVDGQTAAARPAGGGARRAGPARSPMIYLLRNGAIVPVKVAVGAADGRYSEVAPLDGAALAEGETVITGDRVPAKPPGRGMRMRPF